MSLISLLISYEQHKILPIPNGNHIRIFLTGKKYLVEFMPNNESRPRILWPDGVAICLDENYIPAKQDCWIKISNENYDHEPVEILLEFFLPDVV